MKRDRLDALERFVPLFDDIGVPFERFVRRRDRKRRNQRIASGIVGISIFLAAVSIVAVEVRSGPSNTPIAPPTSVAPAPPPAARIGLVGLAPEGMSPSLPVKGDLVVSFFFGHTGGDMGRFHVYVYEDGRMIWLRLGDTALGTSTTGWIEQRLTPEGVEAMRAEVISTGLFEADAHLVNSHGLFFGDIGVRDGGRFVRVTWGDVGVDEPAEVPTVEQANALKRLDARFADPASWLPADAWQDPELRPFVPSMYSACLLPGYVAIELGEALAPLPPAARDLLQAQGLTRHEYTNLLGTSAYWCADFATDDAHALVAALGAGGQRSPDESVFGLSYRFFAPGVQLEFAPTLPDQV